MDFVEAIVYTIRHSVKAPLVILIPVNMTCGRLSVHFEEKPAFTHSEMTEAGILLDYRDETLVGLTVLEASRR
jgi:hypothetical protein